MLNRFCKSTLTDIKTIGAIFFFAPIIEAVLIIIMFVFDKTFYFEIFGSYAASPGFYLFVDFIVPVLMMFNVLLLFSEVLKRSTFEFFSHLPLPRLYYGCKYFRLILLSLIPHVAALLLFNIKISTLIEKNGSFFSLLFLSIPTCLFLMSLAFFSVVLTSKMFYSAIISCGYVLLDAASMGTVFKNKSMFISMYLQHFSVEEIAANRQLFLFLTLLLTVLALVVLKIKIFVRKTS